MRFCCTLTGILASLSVAGALFGANVPGRYIVELSSEPVAEHVATTAATPRARNSAAESQRALIVSEQNSIRAKLRDRNATVLDSVNTVANALIVDAPDEAAAAQLASVEGVKRVVPVRKVHMLLDRAMVLHHVPEAWNAVGADRAGAGVKIAIIDTGIDANHPAFRNSSLTVPDSFPRTNAASDVAFTNNKVIVARSYVNLLPNRDSDQSARDRVGHGTALGMAAAGAQTQAPLATINGVAPNAWLGSYKVFGSPGTNDDSTDDAILKALDDAVADGMDVINLSLGSDLAPRLTDDVEVQAVERAVKAGVLVVVAAGNSGPDLNTMSSPATAPSAIAVGATSNDRTFVSTVEVSGVGNYPARRSDQQPPDSPVSGSLADVAAIDGLGLACDSLRTGSLTDRIALILRGTCTFETKLNNAQRAGARGAVVYAAPDSPDPIPMGAGAATLPAEMISNSDGTSLKGALADHASLTATIRFDLTAFSVAGNLPADFSGAGPNVDSGIKPDLSAVGVNLYTATQTYDSNGAMYDPSGFVLVDGTSFSTPLVAGAAALLKSARPGLTTDQYRSLLINSVGQAKLATGDAAPAQKVGAGILDVNAAVHSMISAAPVSLSFGTGSRDAQVSRTLTLSNLGTAEEAFSILASGSTGSIMPAISKNTVQVAAGTSVDISITFSSAGLQPGAYQGYISITGTTSGSNSRIPWWYAVPSGVPARITLLDSLASGRRGASQSDAAIFRITDAAGVAITDVEPTATVISGAGTVRAIRSQDNQVPGAFALDVRLGAVAGGNVFRITAGDVSTDVSIAGR